MEKEHIPPCRTFSIDKASDHFSIQEFQDAYTRLHAVSQVILYIYYTTRMMANIMNIAYAKQCISRSAYLKFHSTVSALLKEYSDLNPLDAGRRSTDFAQTSYAARSLLTDGTVYERSDW